MSVHSFTAETLQGKELPLSEYSGKVLLIVNTASKCGLTPQYVGLQELYTSFEDKPFEILGFPCNQFGAQEPGSEEEIEEFCSINYGVSFPMFAKVDVNGEEAHPLYKYLTNEAPHVPHEDIPWNFTKFLIDQDGRVVKRFEPTTEPSSLKKEIEEML
ncbi:glutathione peroxidase [Guptibacillus hwajinpoensis]|uniref:Glutathione peroxidase n=1 Tax=Guptibacillus hwajinpoensis TaxID=208199 RepID=A0A0J6FQB1_9BACL|nr:glutathione peroxidase [Alkalihalobacillus macyae]KMM36532.1 glutathione peroxidase [Alkalihalobacillus macyae]